MNNKTIFVLALKNLRRHIRRTVINIINIAVTVGIIYFFLGYYRGTYFVMMRESFINYKSSHIQIHTSYFDEKKVQDYVVPKTVFDNYVSMVSEIKNLSGIKGVSPRLTGIGFFGNGKEKMVVTIHGIVPEYEDKINVVKNCITNGTFLDKSDGVIIGYQTAELFGLKVGDLCYIQSQTVYNSPNIILLPVVGIYNTGFYELDKNTVFVSLKDANILFDTNNSVNQIYVFLENIKLTDKIFSQLNQKFSKNGFDIKTWKYYGQALLENEKGDGIFYTIFLAILLFISISTIMSTMYISVFERIREIGTLRSIGWTKKEIFKIFVFESLSIGIIGAMVGFILGGIPTLYLKYVGVKYSLGDVVSIPMFKLVSEPEYYDLIIAFCTGIIATYVGALFPARKASKMVITDALRVH